MHDYLDNEQKMAITALKELNRICDMHQIRYFLIAGSTLGAIRHQGMIPWDDDVDVGVLYDDWYRLREILLSELCKPFTYIDNMVDESFPRMFGKILFEGRNCVDIWLIVKWTSNPLMGNLHWQIRRIATTNYKYELQYRTIPRKSFSLKQKAKFYLSEGCHKLLYWCLKPFCDKKDYIRMARWNEKYFENRNVDCYVSIYSGYPMKKILMRKEWIETLSYVEFEGEQYPTVGDVHAYLTCLYGNYMTPPSEKKRNKEHQEIFNQESETNQ